VTIIVKKVDIRRSDIDKEQEMTTDELKRIITEYGMHLYSFCCNMTGNRMDADDLYQDTILKAVELRHRLDSSGNPKSYLMGISVKLWQNHRKKYAIRQRILPMAEYKETLIQHEIDPGILPEGEVIRKELIQEVRTGIKRLPEKLRIVLYMYYTVEMSLEEISQALHIPRGTVKSRLYTGRNQLREYLEVCGYE
jgi:RNA polymerase sigma-70 factor (ECF subfamily)